ncbi:alpha-N-acetylglucosaminidase [Trametes elegans]|nr:alpha-N-acetylglucosaminidase [Trametes elegans]
MLSLTRLIIILLACGLVRAVADSQNLQGIYALVKRRIPKHADVFSFSLIDGEPDAFVVSDAPRSGRGGGVHIECTTVSACARGLYTYLTQSGGVDIWWTGSRLNELPSRLPKVGKPIKGQAIVPYRYHFNTVTFDYTSAFWDFEQWELELDWLALRGVNLPLAWVGYEYILIETFREAGLSDGDISDFLSGPAFQAWNRFGNIQGSWGGSLPTAWVNDQFALQKRLLPRMVELGMMPVLPAFTGFVPRALAALYPNTSIVTGSQWSGFPATLTNDSFLEPSDALFSTLQASFLAKQRAAYGALSHVYTLDQYNENDPFSGAPEYLRSVAAGTFASLRAADPDAVWLMQGWLFFSSADFWTDERVAAYLGGVPGNDSMIVLDLYSEAAPQWNRTQSYYGKQWVWCELHGYGGNMGLEGNLDELTHGPLTALKSPGSSMKGIGLTMEGQEGNEIVYDILLDQAWSAAPLDISSYADSWVARRYLVKPLPKAALDAWKILSTAVYNNRDPSTQATIKSIYELAPALTGLTNRTGHHPTAVPYDTNTTVLPALKLLLKARAQHPALGAVPEFAYDVVDVARQLLSNRFIERYTTLVATYNDSSSTAETVTAAGAPLLALLADLDGLLYTNGNFLLSRWIADARKWAHGSASYGAYLEYNARNQVTLWGPGGEIDDYASKAWAGLVGTYYKPRWEAFVAYLADTKRTGNSYNATFMRQTMLALGEKWDNGTWGTGAGERWGVHGNTWSTVARVLHTWA